MHSEYLQPKLKKLNRRNVESEKLLPLANSVCLVVPLKYFVDSNGEEKLC